MKLRTKFAGIALAAMASVAPMAAHAELVTNGGFETGDFTAWNVAGNTGHTGVDQGAASGTFGAYFGAVGSPTQLSQTLATVAGGLYTLSFDLEANSGGNLFAVNFGGPDLLTLQNTAGFGYTHYSYDFTAAGSDTLTFWLQHDPAYWHLDNVSVVESVGGAVPEPATWAMLIAGFGLMGVAMRRRRALAATAA